jgi:pumilio RNA-binding family
LIQLAQHKFASNVCEKALICVNSETRRLLINEIMTLHSDGQSAILAMVKDRYASEYVMTSCLSIILLIISYKDYVLQCALKVVENDQQKMFFQQIKPVIAALRKSTTAYNRPLNSSKSVIYTVTEDAY